MAVSFGSVANWFVVNENNNLWRSVFELSDLNELFPTQVQV